MKSTKGKGEAAGLKRARDAEVMNTQCCKMGGAKSKRRK